MSSEYSGLSSATQRPEKLVAMNPHVNVVTHDAADHRVDHLLALDQLHDACGGLGQVLCPPDHEVHDRVEVEPRPRDLGLRLDDCAQPIDLFGGHAQFVGNYGVDL